jgi:hypothetical protein
MRHVRSEAVTVRAVWPLLMSLAFALGCSSDGGDGGRACSASDLGCECSASTVDDGKACAAASFQNGYCCENEAAGSCQCVETACARSKDTPDFCSCAFKDLHDPAEDDFVESCPGSLTIKCCLNRMESDLGSLCTCSVLDCLSFQTPVASCTPDIVAECAMTEPSETCE